MMRHNHGFTLVELLVTLAILSIVTVYAVPTFRETIRNNQLKSSVNGLYSLFQFARAEAAQKGQTVYVGAIDNINWSKGAVAWLDQDADALFDSTKDIEIRRSSNNYNLVVAESSGILQVVFNGKGYADAAVDIGVCDSSGGNDGKQLKVLVSGIAAVSDKGDC